RTSNESVRTRRRRTLPFLQLRRLYVHRIRRNGCASIYPKAFVGRRTGGGISRRSRSAGRIFDTSTYDRRSARSSKTQYALFRERRKLHASHVQLSAE